MFTITVAHPDGESGLDWGHTVPLALAHYCVLCKLEQDPVSMKTGTVASVPVKHILSGQLENSTKD